MHRTEGENATSGNLFTNGPPGTTLEENWCNAVQEELAAVIEAAGLTLKTASTETRKQLLAALQNSGLSVLFDDLTVGGDVLGDMSLGAGNLVIGTSGKGVDFSAAGEGILDDYEEGLHEVAITCSVSGSYTMSTDKSLAYTKVGRVVHVQGSLGITSETAPNGSLQFSLPFATETLTKKAVSTSL